MKKFFILFCFLFLLVGCSNPDKTKNSLSEANNKLIIEQYFYSSNEENLRKLSEKLIEEGYKINDYRSYEWHGETVWYFYSSKEVTEDEINQEDIMSENYAKQYNVGYDGHGFPLE